MIFGFKDTLRQAVEAASGGLATVMYTPKGQPIFMRRVTPFRLEDLAPDGSLGTGWHPAFPNGREFWVSIYRVTVHDNEPISVPGVAPSVHFVHRWLDTPYPPGMRPIYLEEFAALALIGTKLLGDVLRGNDSYGSNVSYPWEAGVRIDGLPPGNPSGVGRVLAGSGPVTWRHDHTPFGTELLGNDELWIANLRFVNGQFQLRGLTSDPIDPFDSSGEWFAVSTDGTLVPTTQSDTLGYTASGTIGTSRVSSNVSFAFATIGAEPGINIPPLLRALGLVPSLYTRGRVALLHGSGDTLAAGFGGTSMWPPAAPGTIRGYPADASFGLLIVYRE